MSLTIRGNQAVKTRSNTDGSGALTVALGGNDGTPVVSEVTVGTSATKLCSSSAVRRSVLIVNNGSGVIFVAPDNTASTGHGIPIPQYGYLYDDSTLSAWWGVVATSTGDARILEID